MTSFGNWSQVFEICSPMQQSKLRLLFLTFEGDLAGSTNSIAYLTKGLARLGHEVHIGIRRESLLWKLLEGSEVNRIPMTFKGKFDFENWRQIRDAVNKYNIQLINAQSSKDRYTSIFASMRYGLNTKLIHTRRQMPLSVGGPLQLFLYNKKTDGIVAVSHQVKAGLAKTGIKEDHIKVIYNGTPKEKYEQLDPAKTEALRQKFDIQPGDFVIGCVSRIKNQEQILRALPLVEKPVKVVFCGFEPMPEFLEMVAQLKTGHQVFFEGHVPGNEILNYYPLFDINILASTMEGLSQSLLEAMAMGVPVTATAFAGNLDLIKDGENGLFFQDGDIEGIAQNIKKLREDEGLRARLREQGRKTALETYSIENTIRNYEAYFAQLIGGQ